MIQQKVPLVGLQLCLIHKHYKPINNQHLKGQQTYTTLAFVPKWLSVLH